MNQVSTPTHPHTVSTLPAICKTGFGNFHIVSSNRVFILLPLSFNNNLLRKFFHPDSLFIIFFIQTLDHHIRCGCGRNWTPSSKDPLCAFVWIGVRRKKYIRIGFRLHFLCWGILFLATLGPVLLPSYLHSVQVGRGECAYEISSFVRALVIVI